MNVDVDDYFLRFVPGTFDNWIPRGEFRRKCIAWHESVENPVSCQCFYDYHSGRISASEPKRGIHICFNFMNILFEIEGGLQFPQIHTQLDLYSEKCANYFRNLCRSGTRRHLLKPEKPIYMRSLSVIESRTPRHPDSVVVNALHDGSEIDIVQTISGDWITREEALEHVKTLADEKEYVRTANNLYKSEYLRGVDISNIDNVGVVHSKNLIYLRLDEELGQDIYRDNP